jgi:glycosyltransferase involved in cell wall biosynthesis
MSSDAQTRVLLVRGHHPTVWGMRPFERLPERFDARLLVTGSPRYSLDGLALPTVPVRTVRDALPRGRFGDVAALALPDRVRDAERVYSSADIVHTEELSLWFTAQAAHVKPRSRFKLVVTVWETIPLLDAFRTPHARRYRRAALEGTDLFLAATDRARDALLLEGVPPERVVVAQPGVDVDRFAAAEPRARVDDHVIVSPGRLEWEKGHHDVLRAVAALRRGLVPTAGDAGRRVRALITGSGPEERRLREHAAELGIADAVEIRRVPYDDMPAVYAGASAVTLASLPRSGCTLHPADIPRCFWEEQFGLVLAEAMAAGVPLAVSTSGAIPEVVDGHADVFAPGDWMGLARTLAAGPLGRPAGTRVAYPAELVRSYSIDAAADRIAAAYDRVLT